MSKRLCRNERAGSIAPGSVSSLSPAQPVFSKGVTLRPDLATPQTTCPGPLYPAASLECFLDGAEALKQMALWACPERTSFWVPQLYPPILLATLLPSSIVEEPGLILGTLQRP